MEKLRNDDRIERVRFRELEGTSSIAPVVDINEVFYNITATAIIANPIAPTFAPLKLDAAPMKFAGMIEVDALALALPLGATLEGFISVVAAVDPMLAAVDPMPEEVVKFAEEYVMVCVATTTLTVMVLVCVCVDVVVLCATARKGSSSAAVNVGKCIAKMRRSNPVYTIQDLSYMSISSDCM